MFNKIGSQTGTKTVILLLSAGSRQKELTGSEGIIKADYSDGRHKDARKNQDTLNGLSFVY
ncbi:protein of unknown function [Vibrio tapetis subsp. tapetis]|uniref:Uncharacterized protein n=1 Tax=Vibrio tapetis subsp. tapetis TaxID=1671868 RepID=A0A2N8ZKT5_9VIBR|nr:protein of unknown function [Vibrio tapetis subsp. tapetis]